MMHDYPQPNHLGICNIALPQGRTSVDPTTREWMVNAIILSLPQDFQILKLPLTPKAYVMSWFCSRINHGFIIPRLVIPKQWMSFTDQTVDKFN